MQGAQWPLVPGRAGQLGSGLWPAQLFWRLHPHHWCDRLDPAGADLRSCPPAEQGPTSWTQRAQGTHRGVGSKYSAGSRAWRGQEVVSFLSPNLMPDISLSEGTRREVGHPLVVQTTPEGLGWSPVLDGGFSSRLSLPDSLFSSPLLRC